MRMGGRMVMGCMITAMLSLLMARSRVTQAGQGHHQPVLGMRQRLQDKGQRCQQQTGQRQTAEAGKTLHGNRL